MIDFSISKALFCCEVEKAGKNKKIVRRVLVLTSQASLTTQSYSPLLTRTATCWGATAHPCIAW